MTHGPLLAASLVALAGAALVGGTLFGFSAFVMPGLGRVPPAEGLRAMQAINAAALRPAFLAAFLGAAAASVVVGAWALVGEAAGPARSALLAGSLLYLVGVFAVTAVVHVPRNEALAAVDADTRGAPEAWARYRRTWTVWNHVRAAAGLAATVAYGLALRSGS